MTSLEKILFYLLIFCLPFQTRKILFQWGENFNEWSSAYLYLTDCLILAIFLLWFWRVRKQRFFQGQSPKQSGLSLEASPRTVLILAIFLIVALVSLINAQNFWLGFYQWFKLLEFVFLFFYLKYNFKKLFHLKRIAQVFLASAFFQSLIAIGQYINQQSLSLKYLAESPLSPSIAGVAKIVVDGIKLIRPYGTFPHPNLLATFLCLALFCLFFIYLQWKPKWMPKPCGELVESIVLGLLLIIYFCLFFTLCLTFSRAVILTFVLAALGFFIWIFLTRSQLKTKVIKLFLLFIVLCSLFFVLLWPEISSRFLISSEEQAVSLRLFYNQTALDLIKEYPFLGIGLGNFVWEIKEMLPLLANWLHQPVHNIYLLIGSEIGLIGLGIFLFFLFSVIKRIRIILRENYLLLPFVFCLFIFLIIGLFDHFFWTLQQGQLMFWIVLGLLFGAAPNRQRFGAAPNSY